MIAQGLEAFAGRRVLLLQGPVGPFFRRLAQDLRRAGAQVFKVNFNGGDWLFYPTGGTAYRGRTADWPAHLDALLQRLRIDQVLLFGDCRPIHHAAVAVCRRQGVPVGVFEEGYIRPDYVTLDWWGANNNSLIPRTPESYLWNPGPRSARPKPVGNTYWHAVLWAILYYLAADLLRPFFRHYRHHRPLTSLEGWPWLRSLWRKAYYAVKEQGVLERLTGTFFLVPLQVHNDAQVHVHSAFASVADFIDEVMTSFARHAPQEAMLVIKHHPFDRGYRDYAALIRERAEHLGLKGRCLYIHDQHLPTLLQRAHGVVVINSTVGLSALHHGTPLKVCGRANYDMPGLTFQGTLAEYWRHARQHRPDRALLRAFHGYLVQHTQLNGSFYRRLPGGRSASGLRWPVRRRAADGQGGGKTGEKECCSGLAGGD